MRPQVQAAHAAASAKPAPEKRVMPALLWSLLPGGGEFYLGNTGAGVSYAALTATFLVAGAEVQRRNDELGIKDEVNVPELIGEKVWEYSIFSTYRDAMAAQGVDLRAAHLDDTPTSTLLTAPFNPDYAFRWPVIAAAVLGAADGAITSRDHQLRGIRDVDTAHMFGSTFNRDQASALYAVSDFGVSLGAAAAEEGLFRGILQTELQGRWGQTGGLWAAAGTFGAAHIVAPDGSFNPGGVLFASAAGAGLGWLYNHDDNRLGTPIAAHFWYDFMVFAASWVVQPDNNGFGFKVDFRF